MLLFVLIIFNVFSLNSPCFYVYGPSPWYNHTGWLGAKHQVTYLYGPCFGLHQSNLVSMLSLAVLLSIYIPPTPHSLTPIHVSMPVLPALTSMLPDVNLEVANISVGGATLWALVGFLPGVHIAHVHSQVWCARECQGADRTLERFVLSVLQHMEVELFRMRTHQPTVFTLKGGVSGVWTDVRFEVTGRGEGGAAGLALERSTPVTSMHLGHVLQQRLLRGKRWWTVLTLTLQALTITAQASRLLALSNISPWLSFDRPSWLSFDSPAVPVKLTVFTQLRFCPETLATCLAPELFLCHWHIPTRMKVLFTGFFSVCVIACHIPVTPLRTLQGTGSSVESPVSFQTSDCGERLAAELAGVERVCRFRVGL